MTTQPDTIRILFLGGAKRVSMARMLREAASRRGYALELLSYELGIREPIAVEAEVIPGLRWSDPDLDSDLRQLITGRSIDCVIPFVDGAIAPAARLAQSIPQLYCPGCTPQLSEQLYDKVASAELFAKAGLPAPDTIDPYNPIFPIIAKPRRGSASRGILVIRNAADLQRLDPASWNDYIFQRFIEHAVEYTVDCFVSREGEPLAVSPRIRLVTVGGEVSRTRTVPDPALTGSAIQAIEALGLRGAVTLQYLRAADSPELTPLLMEINPRLGGGAVCSVHAGADIPGMIIDEITGVTPIGATAVQPYVEVARYQQEVVFYPDEQSS